ncbi:MAG: serpin family protein [Deltaproteobacteria bacterium]
MKSLYFLLIAILILSCTKEESIGFDFKCSDNIKVCELAHDNNDFGFSLFSILHGDDKDDNLFISPLSVSTALAMTMNGAEGDTKYEMQNALKYNGWPKDSLNSAFSDLITILPRLDKNIKMNTANSIWYRSGFNVLQSFLDVNNKFFNAEIKDKDFSNPSTIKEINTWVEDKTAGKIKDIVKSIDPATVMMLINAIYFKAQWKYEFDKKNTSIEKFRLENGSTVDVDMMHASEMQINYFSNNKLSMVDLPYGDSVYSMTIILPNFDFKVDDIIKDLNITNWEYMRDRMTPQKTDIAIPKFKLEYREYLKEFLKKMGMKKAFDPGNADFSGINGRKDLYIDEVIHQSFVEVDEAGTEAAAATVVVINVTSTGNSFIANKPFIFLIRDNKTNSIQFIGKVMNPGI